MTDIRNEAVIAESIARALVDDPESLGLSTGEGSLHIALSGRIQEVIEDVYADCGDSTPSVLADNISQRLAHLLPTAILDAAGTDLCEGAYQRGHEDGYWNGKTTGMTPQEAAAFMAPYRATDTTKADIPDAVKRLAALRELNEKLIETVITWGECDIEGNYCRRCQTVEHYHATNRILDGDEQSPNTNQEIKARSMPEVSRIYIAGPMTGYPAFNYPAFHQAAARLRDVGYVVENPAETDRPLSDPWREFMKDAIAKLITCDAVALLPGWEKSTGAQLEYAIADKLQLEIFDLDEWFEEL